MERMGGGEEEDREDRRYREEGDSGKGERDKEGGNYLGVLVIKNHIKVINNCSS